jgi:glycosyltransferase involved in cell wall biosynthesis
MESGGVETGVLEVARQVAKTKDFNMFLLSSGGGMLKKMDNLGINFINLNVKSKNPITIYKNINKIKKIIEDNGIEMVQVESRAPAWSCYFACKSLNIPMVTTIHGLYNNGCGIFSFFKKKYNSIMFRGNPIICVSSFVKDYSIGNFKEYIYKKQSRSSVEVLYRSIDTNLYSKEEVSINRILALQNELKLPDDKIIITVPARFAEQKGQDYFLKVLKHLKYDNYFCLLIGDTLKKPKYVKQIEVLTYKYGLQGFVKIHNNISDMPALYSLSNILVSASVKPESFGRISIEAQAMEKIFIGTAIGGTLETVLDGETGFLVPENNEREFARILDKVITMPEEEKKKIVKQGRERVVKNFAFDNFYGKLLKLYERVLNSDDFRFRN